MGSDLAADLVIRKLEERDVPAVAELYRRMYREQKTFGMVMEFQEDNAEELVVTQAKSRFHLAYVLAAGESVVGFAAGSLVKVPAKYKLEGQPMIGLIQDVYVAEDHRKGGNGHRLVERLEESFREQGVTYVELQVLEGNIAGWRFWENEGYGEVIRVLYKFIGESGAAEHA
jgi:ribosomal protein S18 acetylase RimI-like enzyme